MNHRELKQMKYETLRIQQKQLINPKYVMDLVKELLKTFFYQKYGTKCQEN
jgi:hypothetical protein